LGRYVRLLRLCLLILCLRLSLLCQFDQLHLCDLGYRWDLYLQLLPLSQWGRFGRCDLWRLFGLFDPFGQLSRWRRLCLLRLFCRLCPYHRLTQGLRGRLRRYFRSDHRDPLFQLRQWSLVVP